MKLLSMSIKLGDALQIKLNDLDERLIIQLDEEMDQAYIE